jgi:hypothetical protein
MIVLTSPTTTTETKMETKIEITLKSVYGQLKAYPACRQAGLLAELAGTRTLTSQALCLAEALGFKIHATFASAAVDFPPHLVKASDLAKELS